MRKYTGLITVLLLAVFVRAYGVVRFPFEQDELYTIDEATNLFHTKLLPGVQARPVFFLLEHSFVTHLPQTPAMLRSIPLVFGLLGVWATWALARRTLGDRAGIVAALLVAISPWHMEASGFARYYSLLYLLATVVYWLIPAAIDDDRPRTYLWTSVVLLLGAWTHPSFIFPVASAILAALLVRPNGTFRWLWPSRRAWVYLWGPFFGLSLAGLIAIRLFVPAQGVANGGDRGLPATLRLIPAMVDWMTPIIFIAAALGALALITSRVPGRRRLGFMVLFGVAGMLVALFALSFVTGIYADYGIAALPLIFVAVAGLVEWLVEALPTARQRWATVAIATVLIVGVLPSALSHLSDGTRFDYRPAFARIQQDAPKTTVLAWPIVLQRWYAPRLHAFELPTSRGALDTLLTRERDLWAVVSVKRYGIVGDDTKEMTSWLSTHCRQTDQYQRPRLDYRMYRVDLWRCTL